MNEKILSKYIQSLGMTNEEFADYIEISIDTLKNWLYRQKRVPDKKVDFVMSKIKLHKNYTLDESPTVTDTLTGYYYPGVSASAGLDLSMVNEELERIPVTIPGWGNDVIFINVYGDSMYPKYHSGDVIG